MPQEMFKDVIIILAIFDYLVFFARKTFIKTNVENAHTLLSILMNYIFYDSGCVFLDESDIILI